MYYFKQPNQKIRIITWFILSWLILNLSNFNPFLVDSARANQDNLCPADIDVVLVMDESGSMADNGSLDKCYWEELEFKDGSYVCVSYTELDITEEDCLAKENEHHLIGRCNGPVYTLAKPNKLEASKVAATAFISFLGSNDQSALVSFNQEIKLRKTLSGGHDLTQIAINSLTANGETNIGDAILKANQELSSDRARPQANQAMILLTDGKANKPYGTGQIEYQQDVDYAKDMASVSADQGYVIFTIGLGSDVNQSMLEYIANLTGGEYYFAPSSAELGSIYEQISKRICEYSSIAGCKIRDLNQEGPINASSTIPGWTIFLNSSKGTTSQVTDSQGCYKFSGLVPGSYTLSEEVREGWLKTYPEEKKYSINLDWEENLTGYDFFNYQIPEPSEPVCGNNIVEEGQQCDDGEANGSVCVPGYGEECTYCSATCQSVTVIGPFCGDGVCDEEETCETCSEDCGECETGNGGNNNGETPPSSNDRPSSFSGGSSGGGGLILGLQILNPQIDYYCSDKCVDVTITWLTNNPSTSYVLYDTTSWPNLTGKTGPDYGYASTTQVGETRQTGHSVAINCLDQETPYYFRPVSFNASDEAVVGTELAITEALTCFTEEPEEEKEKEVKGDKLLAELILAKTVDRSFAFPGDTEVKYTITITNQGNLAAYDLSLEDQLPNGFVYSDSQEQTRNWSLASLEPNETMTFEYEVSLESDLEAGIYTNQVLLSASNHETISTSTDLEVKRTKVLAAAGFTNQRSFALLILILFVGGVFLTTLSKRVYG